MFYMGYYNREIDSTFRVLAQCEWKEAAENVLKLYREHNRDAETLGLEFRVFNDSTIPAGWEWS